MVEKNPPRQAIIETTSWRTANGIKQTRREVEAGERIVLQWYPTGQNSIHGTPVPAKSIFVEAADRLHLIEHDYLSDPDSEDITSHIILKGEEINHRYDEMTTKPDPLGRWKSYAFLEAE